MKFRERLASSVLAIVVALVFTACASQATPTVAPAATKAPAAPAAPAATATKAPAAAATAAPAATSAPQATPTKTASQIYADVMAGWKAPTNKTIKVAYPGKIGFNHVGSVIAWEALKEKGFKVEVVEFTNTTAAVQGVATDEADIGWLSVSASLAAIEKGGDLKQLLENQGMIWRVYGKKDIADFTKLAGKPVADGVAGQITDFLLKRSIEKYKTQVQVIRFNDSGQRTQALLAGKVDAALLAVDNIVDMEAAKPGQWRTIIDYSKEYPELGGSYFTASGKFVQEYPDAVQAMVDAMLILYRRAYDEPDWLLAQAKKFLPQVKDELIKQQYQDFVVKEHLWNPNGNATVEVMNGLEQFYREGGIIKEKIALEKWTSLKFVDAALKKLGSYKFKS